MKVTHRSRGELRLGRLYPDGYRDETSTRPFDAGLITDSLMANAGHRRGTLCLKVRSIGEASRLEINGNGNGFRLRTPDFNDAPLKQIA